MIDTGDEDMSSTSASSEGSGPVGQMQRKYTNVGQHVECNNEEEEAQNDDTSTGGSADDMLMGLEGIKVNKLDFGCKDPFGQPPIGLEMLSYTLHGINLKHNIARQLADTIRGLFGSVTTDGLKPSRVSFSSLAMPHLLPETSTEARPPFRPHLHVPTSSMPPSLLSLGRLS